MITDPSSPTAGDPGLFVMEDLVYGGAFRLSSATFGSSSTNYAVGRLAYNPNNHSLFVAGHATQGSIAEFAIPSPGMGTEVTALPVVETPIQPFVAVLGASPSGNPEGIDRVTGMLWLEGQLIINAESFYDGAGDNQDTSLLLRDANNLSGVVDGYFEIAGRAHAGGYMAGIPAEWQQAFGGEYLTGWSSVHSIIFRYSVGPSLWVFDPHDMTDAPVGAQGPVAATPVWNYLSRGVYGFIVPGTRTFAVFGSSGGVDSGIGYKITQDDGNLCGGYCSYAAADNYNYYWLFDLEEILAAGGVSEPRPYAQGRWTVPFGDHPGHPIIGGAFDPVGRVLYVALGNAGQVSTYDRPPLILSYGVPE